jgi:hypothetical protein
MSRAVARREQARAVNFGEPTLSGVGGACDVNHFDGACFQVNHFVSNHFRCDDRETRWDFSSSRKQVIPTGLEFSTGNAPTDP